MDTMNIEQRSRCMRKVRSKDTKPEVIIRSLLHRLGFCFVLYRKDLPGKPDIVLPDRKKVVLVNGCFWHGGHNGCPRTFRMPATNIEFWRNKLEGNVRRDAGNIDRLRYCYGWDVLVVWECELNNMMLLERKLLNFLNDLDIATWG